MERSIIDFILHRDDLHEGIRENKEYRRISDKRYKIYERLMETLSQEQKELFENFVNLEIDEFAIRNDDYFKMGVKIGVRLVSECIFD